MELIEYLKQFAKGERVALFENRVALRTRHLCLVLENIYQSHNISAVLRSADCFGIQDVHIIENSNEFEVNTEISLGASKWLSLHRYHRDSKNNTA
ncbi:MAG: TrmH family RNA methyltransferase, partial [Flavobacteriales bacterium]|nr:TrmH family RNA methyltransferase [Flavobacteriales bacterium]